MKYFLSLILITTAFVNQSCKTTSDSQSTSMNNSQTLPPQKQINNEIVVIETNMGTIEIKMFRDDAPKTVENFVQLTKRSYYNGVIFHRVAKGFVIQGGDPSGTGRDGESIYGNKFEDEINKNSQVYITGYKRGIVAMANAGPNTNGSQFFICLQDVQLPPNYTIFGKVESGMDVVDKIGAVEITPAGARDGKPKEDVVMKKVFMK